MIIQEDAKYRDRRERMVHDQLESRGIRDEAVLKAMRETPRQLFIPAEGREQAYEDHPVAIGTEETISQPYIVAYMLEELRLTAQDKVLEVGTGSGYQTALLAALAGEVFTIEINGDLLRSAQELLEACGYRNVHYREGDGHLGWPEEAPFNKIIVSASPSDVPEELAGQLTEGGRMILPVGTLTQSLLLVERKEGQVFMRERCRVSFVRMKHWQ